MNISPARRAAFEILLKAASEKAFSSNLLPTYEENLSEKDRGLCHELVLGALRRQMYLDAVMDLFSSGKKLDTEVRIALRIGLYQLLFLDRIPDHSAINESVNLVKKARKQSASGMVNAILRRATREKPVVEYRTAIEKICIETSHPQWLIERWVDQFGSEIALRIAVANNELPRVAFRQTLKSSAETIDSKNFSRSEFIESCYITQTYSSELREMDGRGEIYFQDEASQMVAAAVEIKNGGRFLDVCASPGSKTTAVALAARNTELQIVAGDLGARRVAFLAGNCAAQGAENVRIARYDAECGLPYADGTFDTVLVDAPCSGTGTIRHNPEIRYHLSPDDLIDLPRKQLAILRNASKAVKAGGSLIYSTCSLEGEENEHVCREFLTGTEYFKSARPRVPDRFIDDDGFARTFPHRDDMDGFFIAAFIKPRMHE